MNKHLQLVRRAGYRKESIARRDDQIEVLIEALHHGSDHSCNSSNLIHQPIVIPLQPVYQVVLKRATEFGIVADVESCNSFIPPNYGASEAIQRLNKGEHFRRSRKGGYRHLSGQSAHKRVVLAGVPAWLNRIHQETGDSHTVTKSNQILGEIHHRRLGDRAVLRLSPLHWENHSQERHYRSDPPADCSDGRPVEPAAGYRGRARNHDFGGDHRTISIWVRRHCAMGAAHG